VTSAASEPLLAVSDLSVRYRLGTRLLGAHSVGAVAGIGFTIQRGESLGLVGESGSGKSSIARALLRLVPASGSVRFQGRELLHAEGRALRAMREHLQIIFQDPLGSLDPRMSVAALVAEPLREFRAALSSAARNVQVGTMLARVGLGAELLARYPHQLSGGQAQRVGIARALIVFTLSDQDTINSAAGWCRDLIVFHRFLLLLQEVLGLGNGVLRDLSTLRESLARHDRVEPRLVVAGLGGCQLHFGVNKFQPRSAAASLEPAVHLDLCCGALHYVSETLDGDAVSFGTFGLQRISRTGFHALLFRLGRGDG